MGKSFVSHLTSPIFNNKKGKNDNFLYTGGYSDNGCKFERIEGVVYNDWAGSGNDAYSSSEVVVGSGISSDFSLTWYGPNDDLKMDGTGTLTLEAGTTIQGLGIRTSGGKVAIASTLTVKNWLSVTSGTTLEIPLPEADANAPIQHTGNSGSAPNIKGTVNITTTGTVAAGTYNLISWKNGNLANDVNPTWTLNGDSLPKGYAVTADTENKKYVLTVEEASSDVTVDGITVTADWINDKGLSTVASENNTTVDALLAADSTIKATNGYNYFACYALGLEPDDENSTPKVSIEQGANGTFTVSLSGVKLAGGVAIDLKLLSTTDVTGTFAEKTAEVTTSGSGKDETFTFDATSVTGCEFFKLQIGISAASAASGE